MVKAQGKVLTDHPSQLRVVTLAVYLLGGDQHAVDTEDIAVKAHELAPNRFSWRKHPDQINLELVRVYLSDAKKPGNGALVDGSGRVGWTLTASGLKWAKKWAKERPRAGIDRDREAAGGGSVDARRRGRERERVLATKAWAQWKDGESEISVRDAETVFRIDSYAVGRMRSLKITRLRSMFYDNREVSKFLNQMAMLVEREES
jgi:hypothetical protein